MVGIFKWLIGYVPQTPDFDHLFPTFLGHNEIPNDKRDSMVGLGFKKESCCLICEEVSQEKNNVLVKCKGTCQSSYHISCLGKKIYGQNL